MALDPRETFREEARELLHDLEEALIGLETSPDNSELVNRAFRSLHTIKGSGAMFDFTELVAFAHQLETAFVVLRDEQRAISSAVVDLMLRAKDELDWLVSGNTTGEDQRAAQELIIDALQREVGIGAEASAEGLAPGERAGSVAVQAPHLYRIRFAPSAETFRNGTNVLALLQELSELGSVIAVCHRAGLPSFVEMDPLQCYLFWDFFIDTAVEVDRLHDVFMFIDAETEITITPIRSEEYRRIGEILVQHGEISPERVEQTVATRPRLGETLVSDGLVTEDQVRSALEEQNLVRARSAAQTEHRPTEPDPSAVRERGATIKVPIERLDRLVNLVGELVSLQAEISMRAARAQDRDMEANAEQLERLVREARELSMEMHMVPVELLFAPYRRLVRDLASELGREVQLEISGTETELDKNVVEALRDPLLHIVRNAIDHGIEPPEAREAAGKARQGRLSLHAAYTGAFVRISVRDDGGGVNRSRVLSRARERGLIAPDATLTDAEILDLLFAPGFSTAEAATTVSGRGVGMDVVRRNVERLNGSIAVQSTEGEGTRVDLQIPLTLAIVEGLLAEVAGQFFLINLSVIRECVDGAAASATRAQNVFDFRGSVVPLIPLAEHFGLGDSRRSDPVIVVQSGESLVGLVVSELHGNHQSVVKSLGPVLATVEGVSGVVFLGDGTPALMVDVDRIARDAARLGRHAREAADAAAFGSTVRGAAASGSIAPSSAASGSAAPGAEAPDASAT